MMIWGVDWSKHSYQRNLQGSNRQGIHNPYPQSNLLQSGSGQCILVCLVGPIPIHSESFTSVSRDVMCVGTYHQLVKECEQFGRRLVYCAHDGTPLLVRHLVQQFHDKRC